ncbi:MAG: hypothetical protein M1837_006399 [Sclerophora amabilis]|nr:MAG: hypothetical protein M1837_006399 [Sclerophora amabilis]
MDTLVKLSDAIEYHHDRTAHLSRHQRRGKTYVAYHLSDVSLKAFKEQFDIASLRMANESPKGGLPTPDGYKECSDMDTLLLFFLESSVPWNEQLLEAGKLTFVNSIKTAQRAWADFSRLPGAFCRLLLENNIIRTQWVYIPCRGIEIRDRPALTDEQRNKLWLDTLVGHPIQFGRRGNTNDRE